MSVGNRLAHCRHLVWKPTAGAIAETTGQLAGGRTVQGVHQDPHRRAEPRPACQPRCVGKVRVDYLWFLPVEPAVVTNPSARIGQSFAHFQAQELDSSGFNSPAARLRTPDRATT